MEIKMTPGESKMMLKSMDYIRNNPDVTVDLLPDELLKFWLAPDFIRRPCYDDKSIPVLVFMFILLLRQWNNKGEYMDFVRLNQLFCSFQIVLAATAYCRQKGLKIEAFPVFNIPQYAFPSLDCAEAIVERFCMITGQKIEY